jgi:hypothetical protein
LNLQSGVVGDAGALIEQIDQSGVAMQPLVEQAQYDCSLIAPEPAAWSRQHRLHTLAREDWVTGKGLLIVTCDITKDTLGAIKPLPLGKGVEGPRIAELIAKGCKSHHWD